MQSLKSTNHVLPIINCHIKRIHFIGIGGVGMCGIAKVLAYKGYDVTGSDIIKNNIIQSLMRLGIKIFIGHHYSNINKAHVVVISSAIHSDNPELQEAIKLKIPVMKRAEMLSKLMKFKYGIAIAGTHGKTTTTAMLISIYIEAGLDPTFINGGIIKSKEVQAHLGCSHDFIVEADESDRSFLWLNPTVEIITNIDTDHMQTYHQNFEYLKETFIKFLNSLPVHGYAVVCIDDLTIREVLFSVNKKIITYGFSKDANLRILNYHQYIERSSFTILLKNNKKLKVILNIPGRHNALNATAAIAVAIEEGIHDADILKAMLNFQGLSRRFENLGNYSLSNINGRVGSIMLIDDYGHHPSELHATIMTIRTGWPNKRLVMIFQPHRFTRTHELYSDFVNVLANVDFLLILNIYAAGEKPILGINSQSLCYSIQTYSKIKPVFVPNYSVLLKILSRFLKNNDLILIQGAGTIGNVVRTLFN